MRRKGTGNFLSMIFCSAILAGLAAGAFGTLCAALYWILSGGDTQGNPFGPIWFALAGAGAGILMGMCAALDRLGSSQEPEPLCGRGAAAPVECAEWVHRDEPQTETFPPEPARNGKTLTSWRG